MAEMFVGQLARKAGVNVETLRYYEKIRLMPKPSRKGSKYRVYSNSDLKRLLFIKRSKELGFTLKETIELLELKIDSKTKCGDVKYLAEQKLNDVVNRIHDLQKIKSVLKNLVVKCVEEELSADECPILEAIDYKNDF